MVRWDPSTVTACPSRTMLTGWVLYQFTPRAAPAATRHSAPTPAATASFLPARFLGAAAGAGSEAGEPVSSPAALLPSRPNDSTVPSRSKRAEALGTRGERGVASSGPSCGSSWGSRSWERLRWNAALRSSSAAFRRAARRLASLAALPVGRWMALAAVTCAYPSPNAAALGSQASRSVSSAREGEESVSSSSCSRVGST